MSHFGLCKYSDGVNALKRLDEILYLTQADPSPHPFLEYSDNSAVDNNGVPIRVGPPRATWNWEWLSQPEIESLLAICPGDSAPVYLRTEVNRGVMRGFQIFAGTMIAPIVGDPVIDPAGQPPFPQMRASVVVQFVNLVAVP